MLKVVHIYMMLFLFTSIIKGQINPQMIGATPHEKLIQSARKAMSSKDFSTSIKLLNQAIEIAPDNAKSYLYKGIAEYYLGDYVEADKSFSTCIDNNSFMSNAYRYRGIVRFNLANYSGAVADYTKCLELSDPNDADILLNRATSFIKLKEYGIAESELDSLIKNSAKPAPMYFTKGMMFLEKGDTVQALLNFDCTIISDSCFADGYAQRGVIKYLQNYHDRALEDFNQAIRLDPGKSGYYVNRANILQIRNQLKEAMSDYDTAISLDTNNLTAYYNRGLLRAYVGDNNNAISDLNIVISHDPDNYVAIYNRAILNEQVGDYMSAIKDIEHILETYPNFTDGYYLRSNLLKKIKAH